MSACHVREKPETNYILKTWVCNYEPLKVNGFVDEYLKQGQQNHYGVKEKNKSKTTQKYSILKVSLYV